MPLHVPNVPEDATELDIEFADPVSLTDSRTNKGDTVLDVRISASTDRTTAQGELNWSLLKTVPVAGLSTVGGALIVPLSAKEDKEGRFFRAVAAKVIGAERKTSKPGGHDYHNRAPFTRGKIKAQYLVGEKGARVALTEHLFDPDSRPAKYELVPANDADYRDALPAWAAVEGTALVVDTSAPRAATAVAVRITDEKGATAVLVVTIEVVVPGAPGTPGDVVYVAV